MTAKVKAMETKRTQQPGTKTDAAKKGFHIWQFIGDVKSEFQRITWTNKEELLVYTKIVIGATFMLGMGIYFADLFIQGILSTFGTIARLVGG